MGDGTLAAAIITIVLCCFCGIGGCVLGDHISRECERRYAIEAGVGRYVVDAATGDTDFVYGVKP